MNRREYSTMKAREYYHRDKRVDPVRFNKKRSGLEKSRRYVWKDRVFKKLGNRCSSPNCGWVNSDGSKGCIDRDMLQVDHVNGDGYKESQRGQATMYKRVFEDTTGAYQLLCANCNWKKRARNKEYKVACV